jgi:hypothetical protein
VLTGAVLTPALFLYVRAARLTSSRQCR